MTRKRFVKLMMSEGCSRNDAVKIATYYSSRNKPYAVAWIKENFIRRLTKYERVEKSFADLSSALNNASVSITKAMENISNRMRGAE